MSNIGYRIYTQVQRPARSLVDGFAGIPVPNIDDCMNRMAALPSRLHAMNSARLMGTAYTVSCSGGDNLLFYYALDNAKPGDVIAARHYAIEDAISPDNKL